MLQDDTPLPVDHEAFRHAGRAERQLHRALPVIANTGIRVAVLAQEGGERGRGVADRNAFDRHAQGLETHQLRRLRNTGDAPAREDVDQARLAGQRAAAGLAGDDGGQGDVGQRLADHRRADGTVCGSEQAERHHGRDRDERRERRPEQPALHATPSRSALRRSRRQRPISDKAPPRATSAPPSQISVTNGFHHSLSCQRPCVSGWPRTV